MDNCPLCAARAPSKEATCESCIHFKNPREREGKAYHRGYCHRLPPTYRGENQHDGWPMTRSNETCGEWSKIKEGYF